MQLNLTAIHYPILRKLTNCCLASVNLICLPQPKKIVCLLALLLSGVLSFGQFRKYSNEFLNIGAGARGMGMGGAQVASTKDATSGYWNPAALTAVQDHPSISLMHAEYFAGIGKYDFG